MAASVSFLLQEALQLSADMRIDLAEQLMESAAPTAEAISEQMDIVRTRMNNVERGLSRLVEADTAHQMVREALAAKA
ncbi:hypothetical protein [Prosthecobacter sp.]|uniref:hypothetical protein n=1 Tax=Prosthecobacter sp. TaxID=1965333 RepID=UPI0037849790